MKKFLLLILLLLYPISIYANNLREVSIKNRSIGREDEMITYFIYNLMDYIEWEEVDVPIFCTYGYDAIIANLKSIYKNEFPSERKLELKSISGFSEEKLRDCKVLYIPKSKERNFPYIRKAIKDKDIITISKIEDFTSKGGMLGISIRRSRINLDINKEMMKGKSATISPLLFARINLDSN